MIAVTTTMIKNKLSNAADDKKKTWKNRLRNLNEFINAVAINTFAGALLAQADHRPRLM